MRAFRRSRLPGPGTPRLGRACSWDLRAVLTVLALTALGAGAAGAQLTGPIPPPARPVLLVPGWSDDAQDLEPLLRRFLEAGWSGAQVEALEFENPVGSNREHAGEVARAVDRLLARTGAPEVDVVAHSMGGLAVRAYLLAMGGGERVRRAVFLATPHRGTFAAYLAWGEGGEEMVPGSEFLLDLNEQGTVPRDVRTVTIRTPMDLRVIPRSSATLPTPGIVNLEICCPSHAGLLDDEDTFLRIRNFLRRPPSTAESDP